MEEQAKQIIRTFDKMAANKGNFANEYDEISRWLLPEGEQIFSAYTPGTSNRSHIVDSTGEMAVDNYVAGVMGLATNPAAKWFELEVAGQLKGMDWEADAYLDHAADVMFATMDAEQTSFYKELAGFFRNYGTLGTGILFQGDARGQAPTVLNRTPKEIEIGVDADGKVKRVGRCFELPYEDIVEIYGPGGAIDAVEKAAAPATMDQTCEFIHLVEPRKQGVGRLGAKGKPWASTTVNKTNGIVVREGGFDELPFHIARDERRTNEAWGRGRGWKAVPEVRQLQDIERANLRALQKIIDPPLVVEYDALLSPIETDIDAVINVRRYSTARGGRPVQSLDMQARPDVAEESLNLRRGRIKDIFYSFLLDLLRDPRATATQVLMLDDEQRRKIGPHMVGIFVEGLSPLVGRRFNILRRMGMFGPLPQSLRGRAVKVKYTSPLARALQQQDATSFERTVAVLEPVAKYDPNIFDVIDMDAGARGVAEAAGLPKRWMRSPARVEERRKARAQAAEQQQTIENMAQLGGAAGAMAPLLKPDGNGGGAANGAQ